MLLSTPAWALAAALGAGVSFDLGVRTEVRGVDGGPPGERVFETAPYELAPSAGLSLKPDPRLFISLGMAPHLLLLSGPRGGYAIHSTAQRLDGLASITWRALERLSIGVSGEGSRGTREASPLGQLSTSGGSTATPGQPGPPSPQPLDPGAGLRTGLVGSASGRVGADWRATPLVTIGASANYARTAGIGSQNRDLFPRRDGRSADAFASLAASPLDTVSIRATYGWTRLGEDGRAQVLTGGSRWDRSLTTGLSTSLELGLAATLQDTNTAAGSSAFSRLAPALSASIARMVSASGSNLGASASASYVPYVDPFLGGVRQRLSARVAGEYFPRPSLRTAATATAATVAGSGHLGPSSIAAEMEVSQQQPHWEVGLALRGAYQESDPPDATFWQWGLALTARWRGKDTR